MRTWHIATKKAKFFVQRRRALVQLCNQISVMSHHILTTLPSSRKSGKLAFYAVRIDFEALGLSRQLMMEKLRQRGIGTQVHYIPLHMQPYYLTYTESYPCQAQRIIIVQHCLYRYIPR